MFWMWGDRGEANDPKNVITERDTRGKRLGRSNRTGGRHTKLNSWISVKDISSAWLDFVIRREKAVTLSNWNRNKNKRNQTIEVSVCWIKAVCCGRFGEIRVFVCGPCVVSHCSLFRVVGNSPWRGVRMGAKGAPSRLPLASRLQCAGFAPLQVFFSFQKTEVLQKVCCHAMWPSLPSLHPQSNQQSTWISKGDYVTHWKL
jgi:hypothetical protein